MSFLTWVASVFDVARMEMITHCGLERRQKNKQDQDLKEGDNGSYLTVIRSSCPLSRSSRMGGSIGRLPEEISQGHSR